MISLGPNATPRLLTRFRVEAEAVARLQHPHIVQVYEIGEHEGTPFYTFEYCPGGSLNRWISGTPMPGRVVAPLMETLARAIHFAHEHGILHRDLKPSNILLQSAAMTKTRSDIGDTLEITPNTGLRPPSSLTFGANFQPERWVCKIGDFGLAKRLDEPGETASGAVLGTPSSMAPEQASGTGDGVGREADVYGLGAILYELLTGRPPFVAATVADALVQVRTSEPVRPSRLNPLVLRDLETICLKCLCKEPRGRYASAEELADDLARFRAGHAIKARPVSVVEQSWRWARRNPALASLSGLAAFFLVAWAVAATFFATTQIKLDDETRNKEAGPFRRRRRRFKIEETALRDMEAASREKSAADKQKDAALTERAAAISAKEEATAAKETAIKEKLRTLIKLHISTGVHTANWRVDAPATGRADSGGDPEQAVLWFRKAWELDPDRANDEMHRTRFSWALRQIPDLVGLCFHSERVLDASFDPSGTRVLTRTLDRAYVWDPSRSWLALEPIRHDAPLTHAGFSPDGSLLVTTCAQDWVRLWDARTGKKVREWRASARNAAFSPDGKQLAVAGSDGKIRFWTVESGERLMLEIDCGRPLRWVGYSPKGTWVVSLDQANQLRLHQAKNGTLYGMPISHAGMTDLRDHFLPPRFDPAEKRLLTSTGREAVLWELGAREPRPLWTSPTQPFGILDCDFAVGAKTLVVACDGNSATKRWTIDGDKSTAAADDDSRQDWLVALSPDGKSAAIASSGGQVHHRLVDSWADDFVCKAHTSEATCVAFSPSGRMVLSADRDGTVRIHRVRTSLLSSEPFDYATGRPDRLPAQVAGSPLYPRTTVFSPDGVWEAEYGPAIGATVRKRGSADKGPAPAETKLPIKDGVESVKFAPDSKTVMATEDGKISFWNVADGKPTGPKIDVASPLVQSAFSQDGGRFMGVLEIDENTYAAFVWNTRTGEDLLGPLRALWKQRASLSPDGKLLALYGPGGTRVFDVEAKSPIGTFPQEYGLHAEFAVDGQRLLIWAADSGFVAPETVRLWDVRKGQPEGPPLVTPGLRDVPLLERDGRRVLTFRRLDRCAFLWDGLSGDLLAPPLPLPGAEQCWLSDDGTALISTHPSRDTVIARQWRLPGHAIDRDTLGPLTELMTTSAIDSAGNVVPLTRKEFRDRSERYRVAWLAWRHPGTPDAPQKQPQREKRLPEANSDELPLVEAAEMLRTLKAMSPDAARALTGKKVVVEMTIRSANPVKGGYLHVNSRTDPQYPDNFQALVPAVPLLGAKSAAAVQGTTTQLDQLHGKTLRIAGILRSGDAPQLRVFHVEQMSLTEPKR